MCHIDEGYKEFCKQLSTSLCADVCAVDLRNHGDSPHTERQDVLSMANDVIELMDSCNIPVATIYGHSFGGKLAQLICLLYPSRIHTIIAEDMAICKDMRGAAPILSEVISALANLESEGIQDISVAESKLIPLVQDNFRRGAYLRDLRKRNSQKFHWRMNLKVIQESLVTLLDYVDLSKKGNFAHVGELRPFDKPVLVLAGELSHIFYDQSHPEDNSVASKLKELFPKIEIVKVGKTGHFVRETHPQFVVETVVNFLLQQQIK